MKVVINTKHGGYGLSYDAIKAIAKRKNLQLFAYINNYKSSGSVIEVTNTEKTRNVLYVYWTTKSCKDTEEVDKYYFSPSTEWERTDPDVISVVEEMGEAADGRYARLRIVEIPDDVKYEIADYDGLESIHESHRIWS